jgi:type II secretory pathway component GspD/PulD (secretin)
MRVATCIVLGALTVVAACGGPRLDTRTFELKYLSGGAAERILAPYVFTDRKDAPGAVSSTLSSITIRETPDNLDKITRVLARLDRPKPYVQLHFQIIQADGAAPRDSAIADVEAALHKLFNFKGYRLLAQAVVGGAEGSHVTQVVSVNEHPYAIEADILGIQGSADSGAVRVLAELKLLDGPTLLETTVTLRSNQSGVLGNAELNKPSGTLILVVRPEIMGS